MAQDSFTEVTRESWFGRIGNAFKGILVGFILLVVAFPLLFWNEGRSVKQYKSLKEGAGAVVSATSESVDTALDGKLVHMTGKAVTADILTDPVFGVSANALKLSRSVEMYQWEESSQRKTRKKMGGGTETVTTYTYSKTWSGRVLQSSDFKEPAAHQNPDAMPFDSLEQVAENVDFGAFTLSPSLVGRINNFEPLILSTNTPLPERLQGKALWSETGFYLGTNRTSPTVGDVKVSFRVARPTAVSVIAKQVGQSFQPYATKVGRSIELLQTGEHTAEAMFQQAQASNRMLAWILRLVGFILMFAGLNMMFKLLSVLADVLPILGSIVGAGTSLIAFLLASILSLITIAIAWIVFRPLLGVLLLAGAVVLILAIKGKLKPRAH